MILSWNVLFYHKNCNENYKLTPKLNILNQIYGLYDNFSKNLDIACEKGCSHCCTCNVPVTTIEAYKIIDYLIKEDKLSLSAGLFASKKRFLPKFTINQFAELCVNGEEIPEEENNPDWGKCAFLSNDICGIYHML